MKGQQRITIANKHYYELEYVQKRRYLTWLLFPLKLIQSLFGRLMSYVVFNPLFFRAEKDVYRTRHNNRRPEIRVLNLDNKRNFWAYHLSNWLYLLKNLFTSTKATSNHTNKIKKLISQVDKAISDGVLPQNIHLSGLHALSTADVEELYRALSKKHDYDFEENTKRFTFFALKSAEKALLDSVVINPSNLDTSEPIAKQKFIVVCMPYSQNFRRWLNELSYYADKLNTKIITFDYRGVGFSKGIVKSQIDLHNDTEAHIKSLLLMGAKAENIALYGDCLGANVATKVAANCHTQGEAVNLLSIRGFRSAMHLIKGIILPAPKANKLNPIYWLRYLSFGLIYPILKPIILISGWSMDVNKDYLAIPKNNKDFLNIRSPKVVGKHFRDDIFINNSYASIYSLVKESGQEPASARKSRKFYINPNLKDAEKRQGHMINLRHLLRRYKSPEQDGRTFAIETLKLMLKS